MRGQAPGASRAIGCLLRPAAALTAAAAVSLAACGGSAKPVPPPLGRSGASASPAAGGGSWPTYHRNGARTGADTAGPRLGRAHRIWTSAVDGAVFAEPLVAGGRVIVATENDSLYAFDASSGRLDWRVHLAAPVSGSDLPCGDIDPSGITATPAVDEGAGVVYAVAFAQPAHHQLVAVDLASGAVRWRRGIDPPAADPKVHQQRAALALSRGRVYVAYGGLFSDCGNYHGWILGAPTSGPSGAIVSFRVPTPRESGIWAPSGPAIDAGGNVYVATGNGTSSVFDFGNAVIKLTASLHRTGFWASRDAGSLNGTDTDLGSIGPLLLPRGRAFVIGKSGIAYLISTHKLGGIGHQLAARHVCPGAYGGLAYAGGTVYVPCTNGIFAVRVRGSRLSIGWHAGGFNAGPPIVAGPGLWTIAIDRGVIYQLDRRTGRIRFRAALGTPAHFATPAASGGAIYAAASARISAYR